MASEILRSATNKGYSATGVESQELLGLTCDFKYFHEVQCSMGSLIAQIYTVVVQRI